MVLEVRQGPLDLEVLPVHSGLEYQSSPCHLELPKETKKHLKLAENKGFTQNTQHARRLSEVSVSRGKQNMCRKPEEKPDPVLDTNRGRRRKVIEKSREKARVLCLEVSEIE